MGFLDRFKKKKENEETVDNSDTSFSSENNIKGFKYLATLINSSEGIVDLDSDITLTESEASNFVEGISIQKSLVINGNGHYIDARNSARIFRISPDITVELNGITFKNGFAKYGGAIVNSTNALTITDCIFSENTSEIGGAINNKSQVSISDSQFNNNKAVSAGGAIINFGTLNIINSHFNSNHSERDGGAINNQDDSTMTASKCNFHENNAINGGAISCIGKIELNGCGFTGNSSKGYGGSLSCHSGSLIIEHCTFDNNNTEHGGALTINKMGVCEVSNSKFNGNSAKYGGSIDVFGELIITKSDFITNTAYESGSAIFIEKDANSNISLCKFCNNESTSGEHSSVLTNRGITTLANSQFFNNNSYQGTISNQPNATLDISYCCFSKNIARMGGALSNFGHLTLTNSKFCENIAKDDGGAIDNGQGGIIKSKECHFLENYADYSGGSIRNEGEFDISSNHFKNNIATLGGAIMNSGILTISNSDFDSNFSKSSKENSSVGITILKDNSDADIIFNNSKLKIMNSTFTCNGGNLGNGHGPSVKNSLVNNNCLNIRGSSFKAIISKSIVSNKENSDLNISDCEFINNSTETSTIFNEGNCNVDECSFEENMSLKNNCRDIANESYLKLIKPKFKYEIISKTVLNNNRMELVKLSQEEIDNFIRDNGETEVITEEIEENQYNFTYLSDLIRNSVDEYVVLDRDIVLNKPEIAFYGGGIEIDKDGFVLDGNGHSIEGIGESRIFYITAKKVKLKNIVFKNGFAPNFFDDHTDGGGAIRVIKCGEVELIDCEFIDNKSSDDGGAVFNTGTVKSNSSYEGNVSEGLGGAVCNKGEFISVNDKFTGNTSKLGGAIFNCCDLHLNYISLNLNKSDIDEAIYNTGNITGDFDIRKENSKDIHNHGTINHPSCDNLLTFKDLNEKIADSDEIHLSDDVIFDVSVDKDFRNGISIEKNLTVIGDGTVIMDAKKSASFFRISNKCRVTFRNIIFKNGESNNVSLIENDGFLRFEHCSFLNNRALKQTSMIENSNNAQFIECTFSNNASFKESIFKNLSNKENDCIIEIQNSDLFNNKSYGKSIIFIIGNAKVNISDSNFIYNISRINGSVLHNYNGKMEIDSSQFIDNFAAFYSVLNNDIYANTQINNCEFVNNHSSSSVISNQGLLKFNNSKFKDNNPDSFGTIHNTKGELEISHCDFNDNKSNMGAAITNLSKGYLFKSNFINNYSELGGAINNQKGAALKVDQCSFSNNYAIHAGGAIEHVSEKLLEIAESYFESNETKGVGGSISAHGPFKIESSEFSGNSADAAGVLYNDNDGSEGSITNSTFSDNDAIQFGGVFFNDENSNLTVDDSTFTSNKAIQGGALFNHSAANISKSRFENNYAKKAAGAIDNNKHGFLKVDDCVFSDNHVDEISGQAHGNAIGMLSDGQITDCVFSEQNPIITNREIEVVNCAFTYGVEKKQKDNLTGNGDFRLF